MIDEILAMAEYIRMRDLRDPSWEDAGRIHDWRNHVPHGLRRKWHLLSDETKAAAYLMADRIADLEEWD